MVSRFRNRRDAGRRLAAELRTYANRSDVIVLALPRGGVPVGYEVATALGVPLDVFVVRKLGLPWHEELAMGALASGGVRIRSEDTSASTFPSVLTSSLSQPPGGGDAPSSPGSSSSYTAALRLLEPAFSARILMTASRPCPITW